MVCILALIKADLWEATFFSTLALKKGEELQNAAIREFTLMSDIFSHFDTPGLLFYNIIPKPFMYL